MIRTVGALAIVLLVISVLASCAPKPVVTPTTPPAAATPAGPAWEETWNKCLAEAKKEGKVMFYSSTGPQVRTTLEGAFKDKYGIDLEFIMGNAAELAAKLETERRAGLYLADIYMGGHDQQVNIFKPAGWLKPIKPMLILPEVVDTKNWYQGKLWYVDKERQYIIMAALGPSKPVFNNTEMVKPDEIQSFVDLLNPKWMGKIVLGNPMLPGAAFSTLEYIGWKTELGLDYIRKLVRQQPAIVENERVGVEWVARGKYPIGVGFRDDAVNDFVSAGASLTWTRIKEGEWLTAGNGSLSAFNQAPHPNAAQVFINWLLTKEGQTVYTRCGFRQSPRVDVPTDHLPPFSIRQPGEKYILRADEEWMSNVQERQEVVKEIFSPLMR